MGTGDGPGSAGRRITEMLTHAVATHENVPVDELRPPLYDVIDAEALENLFRNTRGQVTFEYLSYDVTVDEEFNVDVTTRR